MGFTHLRVDGSEGFPAETGLPTRKDLTGYTTENYVNTQINRVNNALKKTIGDVQKGNKLLRGKPRSIRWTSDEGALDEPFISKALIFRSKLRGM